MKEIKPPILLTNIDSHGITWEDGLTDFPLSIMNNLKSEGIAVPVSLKTYYVSELLNLNRVDTVGKLKTLLKVK